MFRSAGRKLISSMAGIGTMALMGETIPLDADTKEQLKALGREGESFDEIVRRLIRLAEVRRLDEEWNRILEEDEFIPLKEL